MELNKIWYVYTIDGYAGISSSIQVRRSFHKKQGRNLENFQKLIAFETRKKAREYEKNLHSLGYEGAYKPRTKEQIKDLGKRGSWKRLPKHKEIISKGITRWWNKRKEDGRK